MTDVSPTVPPLDRDVVIAAAPAGIRDALHALFALDDRLAGIVRGTREPMVGQMRLTWWHDALMRLDHHPAPAEPVLQALQRDLLPHGVGGADLAGMIDGWEELVVAETLDGDALSRHADARGAGLFATAGRLLGGDSPLLAPAGRAWAFVDLSRHLSSKPASLVAMERAEVQFSQAFSARWPKNLRVIGLLSLLARLDHTAGSPMKKALHVARFRLVGR